MKKTSFICAVLLCCISISPIKVKADEGMWLPIYIKKHIEKDMQEKGLELTAEDIYNINNSSIKDAIFSLGGFCTAEIVSEKGLLFTNHHCAYDAIAALSSEEDDYLKDGFWAGSLDDELNREGLYARRLVRMESLTDFMEERLGGIEDERQRQMVSSQVIDSIETAAVEGTHYTADVASMFYGNQSYLLIYETFNDVRLVGAPPSSIGKFGGDTDNWMWPRHTGDFAVLRIYADEDGKPAPYSADNVPYEPLHSLPISISGVEQGDFSMIMGFPGRTERYLTSHDIKFKLDNEQPTVINLFDRMLSTMKERMDADRKLAIEMASDYASLSNYYKYLKGQNKGLRAYDTYGDKQKEEKEIMEWINAKNERKEKYGDILSDLEKQYKRMDKLTPGFYYYAYGLNRTELLGYAFTFQRFWESLKEEDASELGDEIEGVKALADEYLNDIGFETDLAVFTEIMVLIYNNLDKDERPEFFEEIFKKTKGDENPEEVIRDYFNNEVFAESIMLDKDKLDKFLSKPKAKKLEKDPLRPIVAELIEIYRNTYIIPYRGIAANINKNMKLFTKARMEMSDEFFYPDANSTLRLTYGSVEPYYPRDAVFYDYLTTEEGILEKYVPNDEEFDVPEKLLELIRNKDFGPYATNDTLIVNFLTTHDITGGNSGSPVIDGRGNLIGIAFDGNWESMTSDIVVDPDITRTISVDARYVLFIIDKFADAQHIMKELKVVDPKKDDAEQKAEKQEEKK